MSSPQPKLEAASRLDANTVRHFVVYLIIGAVVFVIDAGSFQLLVLARLVLPAAATASYLAGVLVHFTLNRWLNFRNFERGLHAQARTYAAIVFFQYLLTLAIIEGGVHLVNLSPLAAKIIAVAVNIPIGFIAHRYVTFAGGIVARFRSLRGEHRPHRT